MSWLRALVTTILGILSLTTFAAQRECSLPILEGGVPFSGNCHKEQNFNSNFRNFPRILVLADGATVDESRKIAQAHPQNAIIGTDLSPMLPRSDGVGWFHDEARRLPNLSVRRLDVTKRFPLDDGSVDLVYLRSGLCHCKSGDVSCCGIPFRKGSIKRFIREVWRVLDQRNPDAMGFLHGYQWDTVAAKWKESCIEVGRELGFECQPQFHRKTKFVGLRIGGARYNE